MQMCHKLYDGDMPRKLSKLQRVFLKALEFLVNLCCLLREGHTCGLATFEDCRGTQRTGLLWDLRQPIHLKCPEVFWQIVSAPVESDAIITIKTKKV